MDFRVIYTLGRLINAPVCVCVFIDAGKPIGLKPSEPVDSRDCHAVSSLGWRRLLFHNVYGPGGV